MPALSLPALFGCFSSRPAPWRYLMPWQPMALPVPARGTAGEGLPSVPLAAAGGGNPAQVLTVTGRDAELSAIGEALNAAATATAAVVIFGDRGIGKTTLWQCGIAEAAARGY